MSLSFHIEFNGQCRQDFEFYAENLGRYWYNGAI